MSIVTCFEVSFSAADVVFLNIVVVSYTTVALRQFPPRGHVFRFFVRQLHFLLESVVAMLGLINLLL